MYTSVSQSQQAVKHGSPLLIALGRPGPRGGQRPAPRGSGLFFREGAGKADRPPPHRARLQGGRGGDVRRSGGKGPPFRGDHRASGRVPCPLPPTEEGAAGGGEKGGAAAAPHVCDEHRAPACKSCRGHRGVRHCCSRHHEGHSKVLGGGQRCLPVQRRGLQQQAGLLPSGGPALVPRPVTGGEGGDLAGQGAAASPRGGTQGPGQGHGRASEEGT